MSDKIKCEVNEFKLVLGIDGNDGVLLYKEEGEECTFTASIDLMLKFKCEDLVNCISEDNRALNILRKTKLRFSVEEMEDAMSDIIPKVSYEFDMNSTGSTGVYITGIDDESCKCDLFDQIRQELTEEGSDCSFLTDSSFGAFWQNFRFRIPEKYVNKTIKLGILVTKTDCCDFSLLVDNIKLEKDASRIVDKETKLISSPGFDIERICDNKKSWVSNDVTKIREHGLTFRNTSYHIDDDRLGINSKEVEIQIDPASAIECDLVTHFNTTTCTTYSGNCGVGTISTAELCKDCLSPFEGDSYDGLIDIKNRQTFSAYPRLRMALDRYLYNDECCVSGTTALTYENVHEFSKLLNPRFMEIVENMVPSTSIWGGSLMIRNTIFDQQKFEYKSYGLNSVCGTEPLSQFNSLTEGTHYLHSGKTNSSTVEIIKEDVYEVEPKCKSCYDDVKKTCNNVYITKIGAEQMFESVLSFSENVSVTRLGRLVRTEDVNTAGTGDGIQGGGDSTTTTPLWRGRSTASSTSGGGGENTYNVEERFDI